ncbi:glycine receptor subunit alphaZ1-like isoform X2 [Palaemon carinicauda]|uniref:glycine receptor subunit alphaZ1-like isoform X2 n=1 Tax=Palaemon carinicauda TaxID=392227 RepID=UPI0035B593BD
MKCLVSLTFNKKFWDDIDESMVLFHSRFPAHSDQIHPTNASALLTVPSTSEVDGSEQADDNGRDGLFPASYDRFAVPIPPGEDVLPVVFSVKVRDIFAIDEASMDITLEWYIRMYWTDHRLRPPLRYFRDSSPWINIDPAHTSQMWIPTVYIDHAKEITMPSLLVLPRSHRITKQGLMRYSTSVITKIACPMDFTAYPFDKQICFMRLEGYQYRTFEVEYSWHETGIQISNSLRTDHFVANFQIDGNERVQHENSTFPSVQVRISLYRKMSYHVMNTYIPSGLFVIVSWLTFFIPVDVVPGRMVLTITTLLTMVSMFSTVRSESPKVSYAKAIDMWMFFCIILVFTVLVEYTFVIYLHFRAKKLGMAQTKPQAFMESFNKSANVAGDQASVTVNGTASEDTRPNKLAVWEVRLEKYTIVFLLSVFFIFNFIYWPFWLSYGISDNSLY